VNCHGCYRFFCYSFFICLISVFFSAQAQDNRPGIGTVTRLQGAAEASYQGRQKNLSQNAAIYFGDRISTGPEARVAITLADETEVTLGANASLVVDEFVYTPEQSTGKLGLQVLQGAFLFVGGKIEGQTRSNVSITTPVATLGIRGTTLWGGFLDGKYGVVAVSGIVKVTTTVGTVTLTENQGTWMSNPRQFPKQPADWADELLARAMDTITFADDGQ